MGSRHAWPAAVVCVLRAGACALLAGLVLGATPAWAASRHAPTLAPTNTVIDGPSAAILSLSGMAVARDGSGAVVYLRSADGVPHVYVSLLRSGVFGPPQQVDAGLAGASSQPVVAATNGGVTQIAFVNAGTLYTVGTASLASAFPAPAPIASGAANPSLSMSTFGKAYLVFTAGVTGHHDVRYASFDGVQWSLSATALDAVPGNDAGAGTGRPQVAIAGDGTGIAVWGETGHVYVRRVLGPSPSTDVQQVDPASFSGVGEVSADLPVVGTGGDSSYATIAFHELLGTGGTGPSRVLVSRLHASRLDGVSAADNLTTPGAEGAISPAVAVTEYGFGLITAAGDTSHNVFATAINGNDEPGGSSQVNSLGQASAPDAVPAVAGTVSTLIAWQQDQGGSSQPEIRIRYAPDGVDLNPEQVVSTPDLGPTAAAQGLAAGGDVSGDAAVAWVQGAQDSTRIVAAQLFQPPRGFAPAAGFAYSTTPLPQFSWAPASEVWGPLTYTVKVDGNTVGSTQGAALAPTVPLTQGRHRWQASATNVAGLTVSARPATVFVDSLAPRITLRTGGSETLGSPLAARVSATDTPRGLPASDGSGVKALALLWGDHSRPVSARHVLHHVYARRGRYKIIVIAVDRAGNTDAISRVVTIRPKPRHRRKPKHHGRHQAAFPHGARR